MMDIHIITIFQEFFEDSIDFGIFKIARDKAIVNFHIHNLRDFTLDKHKTTDDTTYGGGAGMVMKIEPLHKSLQYVENNYGTSYKILITPQGEILNQNIASFLSKKESITLIPAHYEGVDERINNYVDMELSIGDYILSGGEIPALVIMDATIRLIEGVLGNNASLEEESFSRSLLEYPQYTKPKDYQGESVPEILRNGNHELIRKWRLKESLKRTLIKRPDLLIGRVFTKEEKASLEEIKREIEETFRNIEKR
ncbi:MAG: tRNA (guanosine(37)-N1)-methyltransferase TrmD [Caldisericaceae bacterium]